MIAAVIHRNEDIEDTIRRLFDALDIPQPRVVTNQSVSECNHALVKLRKQSDAFEAENAELRKQLIAKGIE